MTPRLLLLPMLLLGLVAPARSQERGHGNHAGGVRETDRGTSLPALPDNLPGWLTNRRTNHISYRRGPYNDAVYNIPRLARDLNAVAVGHALAYEDLVTGKASGLETRTFATIDRVLKHPPPRMPDERGISPTFGRLYGVLEQVFDWTHLLHAQTIDVLASRRMTPPEKEREIERLWRYYSETAPYAITGLPLNMEHLDSQPYSGAFRRRFPRVNGLFWGYHWLQGSVYDTLYRVNPEDHRRSYDVVAERYHQVELYRTDRPFMPMFGETSPVFAERFPQVANAFDNLHMLHDLVNDILASDLVPPAERERQIRRAVWMVSAEAHRGEKPGERSGDPLHDHRHFHGFHGMGLMPGMTPERMWMNGMGWMSPADCHHCSMPLWSGSEGWRNATLSADGWTMRTRCAACARDMATEVRGKAILRLPTEAPGERIVVILDEKGELLGPGASALFLDAEDSHAGCDGWSRVFRTAAAARAYLRDRPDLAASPTLSLLEWLERQGKKPDTYVRPDGPSANPFRAHSAAQDARLSGARP